MTLEPLELPESLAGSHAVIRHQHAMLSDQQQKIEEQQLCIEELKARLDRSERDVVTLKRQLFGSRRERFVNDDEPAQADDPPGPAGESTPVPPVETPPPPAPSSPASPPPRRRSSKGRQKRTLNAAIPREPVYHRLDERDVPPELWTDPEAKRFFRFVREEVEFQEPRLRVFEHYEEVIVLEDASRCTTQMQAASAPKPLIERCYLGPQFLAYLLTSRFADHIPYYREEDILSRLGFSIHRSTQWRWMRSLAEIVSPLVDLMQTRVRLSHVLGIDETPVPLICPERAGTRSAYLYAQYGDAAHPYVCFQFASHKDEENVRRIVGDYQGYLQSDAYICYELITAASANRIQGVGCWSHARRKFEPLLLAGPHPHAKWILAQIQKLSDIEDRARDMTDAQRLALRQAESLPIVKEIERWLQERDQHELPKSPLREGVNYLRNRWEVFQRFLEDGAIPLDNNRTEAAIKGPVMGKKNWLYFGNETGGQTAAILYTLTMTCKRHCIDVQAYLGDVFRRIRGATAEELEALLPDRWIQSHPEARVMQRVRESQAAANRKRQRRAERRAAVLRC
jgi:transposase